LQSIVDRATDEWRKRLRASVDETNTVNTFCDILGSVQNVCVDKMDILKKLCNGN